MHSFAFAASLLAAALFTGATADRHHHHQHQHLHRRAAAADSGSSQVVAYYGQTANQKTLADFCNDDTVDIIPIGFVDKFPGADGTYGLPGTNFGSACWASEYFVDKDGHQTAIFDKCHTFVTDVATCQQKGKKILISIGGVSTGTQLASADAANSFAQQLWEIFGPAPAGYTGPRPFGANVVDGFDFDIETGDGSFVPQLANALKSLTLTDKSKQYLLTAAPQCPMPDAHLSSAIQSAPFDHVYIQFYNNPACAARQNFNGGSGFNWNNWAEWLAANSKNAGVKMYLGLPASPGAAPSFPDNYLSLDEAKTLIESLTCANDFKSMMGGVMLWDVTYSDNNPSGGKSYAANIKDIMKGLSCYPKPTTTTTTTTTTSTTTTTTSTPATTTTTWTTSTTRTSTTTRYVSQSTSKTTTSGSSSASTTTTPYVWPSTSTSTTSTSSSTTSSTTRPVVPTSSSTTSTWTTSSVSTSTTRPYIPISSSTSTTTPYVPTSTSSFSTTTSASSSSTWSYTRPAPTSSGTQPLSSATLPPYSTPSSTTSPYKPTSTSSKPAGEFYPSSTTWADWTVTSVPADSSKTTTTSSKPVVTSKTTISSSTSSTETCDDGSTWVDWSTTSSVPAGSTTTEPSQTWVDWSSVSVPAGSTTSSKPVVSTKTTTTDPGHTWSDWSVSTTTSSPVDPASTSSRLWSDWNPSSSTSSPVSPASTFSRPAAATTWSDWSAASSAAPASTLAVSVSVSVVPVAPQSYSTPDAAVASSRPVANAAWTGAASSAAGVAPATYTGGAQEQLPETVLGIAVCVFVAVAGLFI